MVAAAVRPPRQSLPQLRQRFQDLDHLLAQHRYLWEPAPFKVARPPWCDRHPALTVELLSLDDTAVGSLAGDNHRLAAYFADRLPSLAMLPEAIALPAPTPIAAHIPPRLNWEVPGRKWAQILAFRASVGTAAGAIVDWCGGQGHLGRLFAVCDGNEVLTLDLDAEACASGTALSKRAQATSHCFVVADALDESSAGLLAGRHALALHACGDLHLALLNGAASRGAKALSLAPCCYFRTAEIMYRQQSGQPSALQLDRDALRIATTETATAHAGERTRRERLTAWKLGWQALLQQLTGDGRYQPMASVPAAWARGDFKSFVHAIADRDGIQLPRDPNFAAWESLGLERQRNMARLELVRHAFRRALELWLVFDRALMLAEAGYSVDVRCFCPPATTPRNLLITAEG